MTTDQPATRFILGSRSPRRRELLAQIVPADQIEVRPPRSTEEAGFDDIADWLCLEHRLLDIARTKCADVLHQIRDETVPGKPAVPTIIIAADTTIVATEPDGRLVALGQPPEDETWQATVRQWFRKYYADRTHVALTGVCVATLRGQHVERIVRTEVTFHGDVERWLDWYLATGESRGKAGGYALQGAGSIFVKRVEGSLSNVVGLPISELLEVLQKLGVVSA